MSNQDLVLPPQTLLNHAFKIAAMEDRPIMCDYWASSMNKECFIGVRKDDGEKLLVKSAEEYTSTISKIFSIEKKYYIILTENSLYIVHSDIPTKSVSF